MYLTAACRSGSAKNRIAKQTIKIMKLTSVLLIVACLQVSARGFSQKVTIKETNISLQKVFEEIRRQTGVQFFYADEILSTAKKVSLSVKKESIENVLNICFNDQQLSYSINENTIIVKRKVVTPDIIAPVIEEPVATTVKGKVTDDKGQPLSGVSVYIKGSTTGTTTDADGNYSITVPDGATLVFSYVGFGLIEEKANGRTNIDILLKPLQISMNEVVVVGYGTQRKRDLTGSVSSVKGEELSKMPSTNPVSSLQGKVPGLTVANSGQAGASPVVRIRGINSTNSASPVYVVDGILHDNIDFLNPADIESIDVLRDPSSIAIYGLRGANGVIAITSKKAARGQSRINLQSSVGVQKVNDKIAITDADGFKKLFTQQLANYSPAQTYNYPEYTANTNWQDLIFQDAVITSTNMSVSNSNDKSTTYLNLGYTDQEGVLKYDHYKRYLIRLNQEIKFNDHIKFGGDITAYHWISDPPAASITNALWAAPISPVMYNDHIYYSMPSFQRNNVGNPVGALNRNSRNSINKGYRGVGNIFAEIKFLKNFTWKSTFYGDITFNTGRSYTQLPDTSYLPDQPLPLRFVYDSTSRTSVGQSQSESRRFQQDHTLTFDKKFGKGHSINAVAGLTTLYSRTSSLNGSRRDTLVNIPDNPNFWYLDVTNPNNLQFNGGGGSESAIVGSFARVAYAYKNKYLLNATIRRDGSSKFAPENRWGTFGSIGAGWVVSDEKFLQDIKSIDFLKIRAAWGLTGNANGFADNLYKAGISNSSSAIFGNNIYSAIQAAYIPDPNLHWETVKGIDVGFDVRALKNRLNGEFTFYNRTSTDILTSVTLPNDSRPYFTNLGKITNKGVEISLGWNDKLGKDFTYGVSANFSYNKNVVNSIGDNINFQLTGNGGVNLTNTGQSIGYFYGYTQIGIYQSTADIGKTAAFGNSLPGDIAYKDINGDGIISAADRSYIGSPFPPYNFGGNITLGYKGLDLLIEAQGMTGHKIYTQRRTATFTVLNYEANRLNAWTAPGTTNIEPIMDNNRGNNFLMSTYYLEPGDYFRLRTLQLGYTFNKSMMSKVGVKNARIYISGQNIKTWSKVTGYSPEPLIGSILGGGADNGTYPVPAVYSLGINLTF